MTYIRTIACALCIVATAAPPESDARYTKGQIVRGDGGIMAYYDRMGDGPCLLLIPGSWEEYTACDAIVDALDTRLRVVVVELPGHGASQPPAAQPSMAAFALDVFRVADALNLKTFYVGGHSIGGMIAIEMAGERPDRLSGVIAIEGWTHSSVVKDAFDGETANTLTPDQDRVRLASRDRTRERMGQSAFEAFGSVWKQWNGETILRHTELPILEIWGDRGKPIPSLADMKIPDRKNITVRWIKGASHWLPIEAPANVAEAINEFVFGP